MFHPLYWLSAILITCFSFFYSIFYFIACFLGSFLPMPENQNSIKKSAPIMMDSDTVNLVPFHG